MKTNHWIQITIIVVVVALLAAVGLSHAAPPVSGRAIEFAASSSERAAAETGPPEARPGDVPEGLTADDWATMQDLLRAAQYQFTWQVSDSAGAYRAPNRAHDLSLSLAADGFHAARYDEAGGPLWDFGLSLTAYGEQTFPAAIAEGGLSGSRERVEYHWSRDVVEWYVNSAEGVEHGLTLAAPPAGTDGFTVELTFALRGSLTPELDAAGQVLRLKDAGGSTVLFYDQLAVYDATGRVIPAHFELARTAQHVLRISIDAINAVYPLTVDPLLHNQVAKLTASDAEDGDRFGASVSISGDTIVVGAYLEDGAGSEHGAAYVFEHNQGGVDNWGQVTKLTASDAEDWDRFGASVAISGDTIVVGAHVEDGAGSERGAAYVFERNQGGADNWGQVTKLTASDAENGDCFGVSVAISRDTVVVGAWWEDGAGTDIGAAYLFERNQDGADNWGQVTKLTASNAANDDRFGVSVALSGDTVVVGASGEDGAGSNLGAAYLFERNQGGADNWGQVTRLTASDAADYDYFGNSVALNGETIVVGADGLGCDHGAAYVFERNQGGADNWGQVTKLTASDAENGDWFGTSVALSGDTIVVGAWREDGAGSDRGAAYLFVADGGQWQEIAIPRASDAADDDSFGYSVALSGETVVVGAYGEDGGAGDPTSNAGAAYVFVRNRGGMDNWGEVQILRASDAQAEDDFGISVAISGDTVVVGAYSEDGGAGDPLNGAGAAYIFARNQGGADNWGEVTVLRASDTRTGDRFGKSVSVSGDMVVVGADREDGGPGNPAANAGAAYIFARNQGGADNWGEVQILRASDTQVEDWFGRSVAISGDMVVVGADGEDGGSGDSLNRAGAAYVFARNQGGADNWGEVQILRASDAQVWDCFGGSVSTSGDTIVVGAYQEDGGPGDPLNRAGAAYVFARNQGGADNWGEVQILRASDAQADDWFGIFVDISGEMVVVGAYYENDGAVYLFERNQSGADSWGQVAKLTASNATDDDWFGISVTISGETIVVGARGEDGAGSERGAAYVFVLQPYKIYLPLVLKN